MDHRSRRRHRDWSGVGGTLTEAEPRVRPTDSSRQDMGEDTSVPAGDVELLRSIAEPGADREIVVAEARLRRAQLDADVSALDQLIVEDLLFTGPDGALATKAEDLAAHASGAVRFVAHDPKALRVVRVNAHVAIAALLTSLSVAVGSTMVQGDFRYTRVWILAPTGQWRVAGGHVSQVVSAPA